jgi:type IV secretion system protein VirB4
MFICGAALRFHRFRYARGSFREGFLKVGMLGSSGRTERNAAAYLPYVGHVSPHAIVLEDGSVLAMGQLHGLPHELAAPSERNAASRILSALWRQLADDVLTINIHLVRHQRVLDRPAGIFRGEFAADLARVYQERVLDGQLFENVWYLTTIVAPRNPIGGSVGGKHFSRILSRARKQLPTASPDQLTETEDIWATLSRTLDGLEFRRLGLCERRGVVFSEIAEALRMILTASSWPVPLMSGPLGSAIYTDRVIFGRRAFEIRAPKPQFGVIFGFREYLAKTRPDTMDAVLALPFPLVMSQSFTYINRTTALDKAGLKSKQMATSGDRSISQIDELIAEQDDLQSGRHVRGAHHFSLAIYADTFADVVRHTSTARTALAEIGASVAQESNPGGMEAAYFAQLPGNSQWRTRPGVINSRNFAHLASLAAFPHGSPKGRWGPAMVRFKTSANTPYDYIPHVDDVGMTVIFGRIGSGKSTWLLFMLAMFEQYLVDRDGIVFFFDKDRGGELLVRAVEGSYLVIRAGEPSGLAPLKGLKDTPADRAFLASWLKSLITLDGHGPVPPADDARLARAVAGVMRLPVQLRSMEALRQFLGWRDTHGAGARLERWCSGAGLGWAFDGDDEVNIAGRMVGFDLTAILNDPTIINPAAHYLLYRIRSVIDGRRAVISLDECKAYLLHEQFRADTEDFLLRARKNNAIVILVTQEPEHLLEGTFGPTMVNQCFTKVFFRNPTADEAVHRGQLFLTEGEFRAITEDMLPGSRQCLIKRDSGSVIIDFDLSSMPEFVAVLSGRATTVRLAEKLRAEAGQGWLSEFQSRFREAVE